jgi:hypothetical protein
MAVAIEEGGREAFKKEEMMAICNNSKQPLMAFNIK